MVKFSLEIQYILALNIARVSVPDSPERMLDREPRGSAVRRTASKLLAGDRGWNHGWGAGSPVGELEAWNSPR